LNKDLFFSGHTATLFLIFLYLPGQPARRVFLPVILTVAMLLLLQHVHYTIDVVAAFPFAYAAFRMVRHLNTLHH
jgi:membrane-associated phospholipid phosphatase